MSNYIRYILLVSVTIFSVSLFNPAFPQQNTLEEIVVTAERREAGIQTVPATVSALSGKDLERRGLEDLRDYGPFVPGLTYSGTAFVGERSGPDITIRGVSNSRLFDFETSIATQTTSFVYGEMPAFPFDPRALDLDRVEILKGPQGTLYGAASMGGTVKIIPNQPSTEEFTASVKADLSTFDGGGNNFGGKAVFNIPIIEDVLAARAMGYYFSEGGFIDAKIVRGTPDEVRGHVDKDLIPFNSNNTAVFNVEGAEKKNIANVNEETVSGGRFALRFTPGDKFEANVNAFLEKKELDSLHNFEPSLSSDQVERKTELFMTQPTDTEYILTSLDMSYDTGIGELISVTGWLNREFTGATDFTAITYSALGGDGTVPVPAPAPVNFTADIEVVSQELRLQGSTADIDALNLPIGIDYTFGYFFQFEDRRSLGDVSPGAIWDANRVPPVQSTLGNTGFVWSGDFNSEYTNNSFFGDITIHLTDQLSIAGGARYSDQELDSTRVDFGNVFAGAATPTGTTLQTQAIRESQWTTRASVNYRVTDDKMIYFTTAEGFRLGGTNPASNQNTPGCVDALEQLGLTVGNDFDSDEVRNFEFGVKTSWLERRVTANASIFRVDWEDLQSSVDLSNFNDTCGASSVANSGEAEIDGIEIDIKAILTENIQFAFAGSYTDAEITDPANAAGASKGDPLKNIPEFEFAAGLEYQFPELYGMTTSARVDYVYIDDRSFNPVAAGVTDGFHLPKYDLLNFRFGVSNAEWDVNVYVDNVLDEKAELGATILPGGPGVFPENGEVPPGLQRFVTTNRPRSFGVSFERQF